MRDIQIRYKQTLLGAAWAIFQPLATSGVATIIFGKIFGLAPHSLLTYFLEVFPAMILWTLFATIITQSSNSLVNNAEMLKKIYFPRVIIPLSSAGAPLLDFCVSFATLVILLCFLQPSSLTSLCFIPFALIITLTAAFGISLALSALTAIYRDFRIIITFITQLLFFLTPVLYPLQGRIPDSLYPYLSLNPMYGPISAVRAFVSNSPINYHAINTSIVISLTLLITGYVIFQKIERKFADVI